MAFPHRLVMDGREYVIESIVKNKKQEAPMAVAYYDASTEQRYVESPSVRIRLAQMYERIRDR